MTNIVKIPPKPTRISKKVRDAINARVRKGKSLAAAVEAAGMSRNGLAKALKRPAVQEYIVTLQTVFVAEVSASKTVYKALSFFNGFGMDTRGRRLVPLAVSPFGFETKRNGKRAHAEV